VTLDEARARARAELDRIPARVRSLDPAEPPYRVDLSPILTSHRNAIRRQYE
jgi:nicotinate phosphoribosyltransferase